MGVLATGSVADRPWGMTLGALGMRGLSGQLTLSADGKPFCVAFDRGAVVGASSPVANDAAVRLALTGNLITSSQVADIVRRVAAAPDRDEVDVLAEACRLQPDQAQRLRRRLVAQRAARTFAVDQGEFVVEDERTIGGVPGSELDVRTIIYLGARNHLGDERLGTELGQLGAWFKLKPEAVDDLPQFGFTEDEKPVLQMLLQGANLTDLQLSNAGLGVRVVRAVTYALAACGACEASSTPRSAPGRSQSPTVPPRSGGQTVPPTNVTSSPRTVLRTAAPSAPPRTAPTTPSTHKTAPLGSRSPAAPSEPPVDERQSAGAPPIGRAGSSSAPPVAGRAATQDSSVARTASASYRIPMANDVSRGPGTRAATGGESSSSSSRLSSRDLGGGEETPSSSSSSRLSSRDLRAATGGDAATPGRTPSGSRPRSLTGGAPATGRTTTGPTPRSPTGGAPVAGRAPTGSSLRSPTGGGPVAGRAPTPSSPVAGRVPTASGLATPRTVTESTGVPRATETSRSSGGTSSGHGQDRSPSSGLRSSPTGAGRSSSSSLTALPRTTTQSSGPHLRPPVVGRTPTPSASQSLRATRTAAPAMRRPKQSTASTLEIEALLAKKIPMLDQGVDYFTLFGLPLGASQDDVRSTYFMLARKLHPDRLAAIGVGDEDRNAQRLMACINEAFAVLNDPIRREEYVSIQRRGGEAAVRAEAQKADELAMRVMRAEEAYRQGEMALRRDQIPQAVQFFATAVELQPNESEYQALYAWAQFAQASDKQAIAAQTRKALIRAADANPDVPTARFYLGRVERMLGREREALVYFYEVLRIRSNHSEAASEARILEQRLKNRR